MVFSRGFGRGSQDLSGIGFAHNLPILSPSLSQTKELINMGVTHNVYLPDDLLARLVFMKNETQKSLSVLIQLTIDMGLSTLEELLKKDKADFLAFLREATTVEVVKAE